MLLHWVLNPAIAINEVLLGQRIPSVTYCCVNCDRPWAERQYVKCPGCRVFLPPWTWGRANALGHYFGLFCPDCGHRIPSLMNLVTLIVVAITLPVWLPIWCLVRRRWIPWEQDRGRRARDKDVTKILSRSPRYFAITGALGFGIPMWLIFTFLFPYIMAFGSGQPAGSTRSLPWTVHLIMLVIWLTGGVAFGLLMRWILVRKQRFQPGHCRTCGYDLTGLDSDRCPECGYLVQTPDA